MIFGCDFWAKFLMPWYCNCAAISIRLIWWRTAGVSTTRLPRRWVIFPYFTRRGQWVVCTRVIKSPLPSSLGFGVVGASHKGQVRTTSKYLLGRTCCIYLNSSLFCCHGTCFAFNIFQLTNQHFIFIPPWVWLLKGLEEIIFQANLRWIGWMKLTWSKIKMKHVKYIIKKHISWESKGAPPMPPPPRIRP